MRRISVAYWKARPLPNAVPFSFAQVNVNRLAGVAHRTDRSMRDTQAAWLALQVPARSGWRALTAAFRSLWTQYAVAAGHSGNLAHAHGATQSLPSKRLEAVAWGAVPARRALRFIWQCVVRAFAYNLACFRLIERGPRRVRGPWRGGLRPISPLPMLLSTRRRVARNQVNCEIIRCRISLLSAQAVGSPSALAIQGGAGVSDGRRVPDGVEGWQVDDFVRPGPRAIIADHNDP